MARHASVISVFARYPQCFGIVADANLLSAQIVHVLISLNDLMYFIKYDVKSQINKNLIQNAKFKIHNYNY